MNSIIAAQLSATSIDLSPLMNEVWTLVGAVAIGLGAAALRWVLVKTGLSKVFSETEMRTRLTEVVENGIAYAQSKINLPMSVDVKNQIVAMAGQYVISMAPDAVKKLGASKEAIEKRVEAEVSKMIGLDVALPVTPAPAPAPTPAPVAVAAKV